MIRVDIGDSAELIEVTSHRHHPKVLGGELDLRVIRVQLPDAHGGPSLLPPWSGRDTECAASCDRSWRYCCGRYQVRVGSSRSWTRSPVAARLRSSPGEEVAGGLHVSGARHALAHEFSNHGTWQGMAGRAMPLVVSPPFVRYAQARAGAGMASVSWRREVAAAVMKAASSCRVGPGGMGGRQP